MESIGPFLGRVLISVIFLFAGFHKITDFAGTEHYMANYGMPYPAFFLVCAIFIEIAGGLMVLLGYRAQCGAIALAIFLVPTTLIFHTGFSDQVQLIMFLKNLAIIGGLLYIITHGPGCYSIDKEKCY